MSREISKRLHKIVESLYGGNKSDFARAIGKKPGSIYQYMRGDRTPGADFLCQLISINVNVNWVLGGKGSMHINESTDKKLSTANIKRYIEEEDVAKMLTIIMQRLEEVEYKEEIKLEILKETLNRIAIEQNTHFIDQELKDK